MTVIEIPIECKSAMHFYNLVSVLNQQVGRGVWTTRGRPVRKLHRMDRMKAGFTAYRNSTQTVIFKVPAEYTELSTALLLWAE